ncbi:MAG TPA: GNAT family N-acetyltransferase [Rhizomicrobium sp.]|jgi:GNAT superfamily N-acetyltransferase
MSAFLIRDAIWPQDRAAAESFIHGSQLFEKAIEPNRRLDSQIAPEFFDVLMDEVAKNGGIVRVAESDGRAVGWVVAYPQIDNLYILESERRYFSISELFVDESVRGQGIGRALIAVCETHAKAEGFKILKIGVLAANHRAERIYEEAGYRPYGMTLRKYID